MRLRRGTVPLVASLILLAATAIPAGASDRGVERGWVEPFPQSELTGEFEFLISGDLSTGVFGGCGETDSFTGLTFVDLATGASRQVSGSPEGDCTVFLAQGADPGPAPTSLGAVAEDGTALIGAAWEGLENGDRDGGISDAFLVTPRTGEVRLLSGSVPGRSFRGLALSDDASRAILVSWDYDGDPTKIHLWDNGALTELNDPAINGWNQGNPVYLSGNGRYLFVPDSSSGDLVRIDLDGGSIVRTPLTGVCCGLLEVAVSQDGGTAAWVGPPLSEIDLLTPWVTTWDMTTTKVHRIAARPAQSAPILLTDDGKTLMGTSRTFLGTGEPEGYFLWSLDVATSSLTILIDERPNGGPWMVLDAISSDGRRAVVSTMGPVGYEPASPDVIQRNRLATRQYLWDADLVAPPHPGSDPTQANRVERLYRAFFGRSADAPGLAHWVTRLTGGATLASVGDEFASSEEFRTTYGTLNDEAFVELLYRNVFDRPADAEGAAYWRGLLARGTSRGGVMAAVSESPEFIGRTSTVAPRPPDEAALRRLYAAYFLRPSDAAGLDYWLARYRSGVPLATISEAFAASPEFANAYGSLDNGRFITMAYLNVVGRYPDPAGMNYWLGQLDGGLPRGELMVAFSQSAEFVDLTTARGL